MKASTFDIRQKHGTYLTLSLKSHDNDNKFNINLFEDFITNELKDDVESFSWQTRQLEELLIEKGVKSVYLTHIG